MIVLDAENMVLGRLCSIAAKQALLGQEVAVVNAEKALVSGSKASTLKENLDRFKIKNKGNYRKGPFHQKRPDRYVRRAIRGMLPTDKARGKEAYKRVMCYIGVPAEELTRRYGSFDEKQFVRDGRAQKMLRRSMTVAEICSNIGGSIK